MLSFWVLVYHLTFLSTLYITENNKVFSSGITIILPKVLGQTKRQSSLDFRD